ncbi:MAG: MiaB/RimO family radical SAM methylthiotransferase [candidate division WOR-3 bacterium]
MKFSLITMGCQMNEYDSERIRESLIACGFHETDVQDANLIVILTCVVREKPQKKALSLVSHHLRRGKRVLVAGCLSPIAKDTLEAKGALVVFPGEYDVVPELLGLSHPGTKRILRGPSAFVTIIEGCENFCSYCVVPYVRGPERPRPPDEILSEIRELEAQGLKDLTLLGQNVSAYSWGDVDFPKLLRIIHDETGIPFIKFTTSHPRDIDSRLAETIAERPRLSRWFHMPLQSGSDRVLALMNRGYTSSDYLGKIDMIRSILPDAVITTDLMVGFPTETEEDFQATLRVVERVGFDRAFMFSFDPRPRAKASEMSDQVPPEVKSERLRRLVDFTIERIRERKKRFIGKEMSLLALSSRRGRTDCTTRDGLVVLLWGDYEPGQMIRARITGLEGLIPVAERSPDPT